ncbi:hypothetical protein Tco_0405087 [Tanacetum coccineum]
MEENAVSKEEMLKTNKKNDEGEDAEDDNSNDESSSHSSSSDEEEEEDDIEVHVSSSKEIPVELVQSVTTHCAYRGLRNKRTNKSRSFDHRVEKYNEPLQISLRLNTRTCLRSDIEQHTQPLSFVGSIVLGLWLKFNLVKAIIDSHNKILYARHADQRKVTFQRVLQTGVEFDRDVRAMLGPDELEMGQSCALLRFYKRFTQKVKSSLDYSWALFQVIEEVAKKTKKQLKQERLRHEEAIRLQEQINEEERQSIARDEEIAKQLQEEIDIARQEQEKYDLAQALELQKELDKRKEDVAETTQAHDIDWSDPVVLRYHAQQNRSFSKAKVRKNMCMYLKNQGGYKQSHFRGMSYEDIRPIFERVWDQNQAFVPKDSEIEKEVMKRPGFDLQKQPAEEEKLQKNDDSSKPSGGSRKKTLARKRASEKQSEEGAKRQKMEDDTEKEELKAYLDIVPGEEFAMDVESLSTKYPIVDWKTHILTIFFMYYQIIRADGSSKNYKIFSEMIDDFDRQDVIDLHRLVKERYVTTSPKGYDLMLWGDLKTLFEPNEEDKVWRNQHGYNLISWRLIDSCGIHILLMDNGIAIHKMVEKKYPLIQEMLSNMLNRKLEIDHESEMAFELLRFIRSQLQK